MGFLCLKTPTKIYSDGTVEYQDIVIMAKRNKMKNCLLYNIIVKKSFDGKLYTPTLISSVFMNVQIVFCPSFHMSCNENLHVKCQHNTFFTDKFSSIRIKILEKDKGILVPIHSK